MEPIIGYCALGAAIIILLVSLHVRQSSQKAAAGTPNADSGPEASVKELMKKSFIELGCQPKELEDGCIGVEYQGERFFIEFGGERIAKIWDLGWSTLESNDPDLPEIREAVNAANFNNVPTVVITNPNEDGLISLHSQFNIMLHPACPDNTSYLYHTLMTFFEAKENVRTKFQELNAQSKQPQKNRRPMGFATDNQTES